MYLYYNIYKSSYNIVTNVHVPTFFIEIHFVWLQFYNLWSSCINTAYCATVIPPRRRSSYRMGNSFVFTILLPCFSNFFHNFPNMLRKSDKDVGRNGTPCPIFAPFNTLTILSIYVPSKALSLVTRYKSFTNQHFPNAFFIISRIINTLEYPSNSTAIDIYII